MKPEVFAQKIKAKYPQYQNVPDLELAQRVIAKYPTYKSQVELPSEVGTDIKQTFSGIKNSISSAFNKQQGVLSDSIEGRQSLGEGLLQAAGEAARGVSRALGEAAIGAGKVALPQSIEDAISKTAEKTIGRVLDSNTAREISESIKEFEKTNPRAARNLQGILGFGELGLDFAGGFGGKQIARKAVSGTGEVIDTAVDATVTAGKKGLNATKTIAGPTARSVRDFGVSQITGLNPETLKTIIGDVDNFTKAKEVGLNRFTVAGQVEEALTKRLDNLSEVGEQYDVIRQSGEVVELPKSWLENEIESQGFVIKDGKIRANTKSPTRDNVDLAGIQKVYDDWAGKTQFEADEFLNLRYDLSKISKFGKDIGKSDELENFGRGVRENLNKYRDQITGLKELDETFAPEKTLLDNLKKEFLDKDGNLKDVAINRIANSTGKGKDQLLDRVSELVPDIKERVNLVKALEDVEYAKGQKVGAYTRALLGGGLLFTGNIPAGLVLLTASNPETILKVIDIYVKKIRPNQAKVFDSIKGKIQKGEKLNSSESSLVGEILNMSKQTASGIIDAVGVGAGVGASAAVKNQE